MFVVKRSHDFSYGHRVVGHENKCRHLHGHNGRVTFNCTASELDSVGRVIDFSQIKSRLCQWLEDNWDHKFLAWDNDRVIVEIERLLTDNDETRAVGEACDIVFASIVFVPFNPTAENMAQYLVEVVGPKVLEGTGVTLIGVEFEETRKCSAIYFKGAK